MNKTITIQEVKEILTNLKQFIINEDDDGCIDATALVEEIDIELSKLDWI